MAYNTRAMTILNRFTMNPTVEVKLIPLDLYNQINNVVNEQRLISKHALDLDVSIPDGMISYHGTHQLSSVLVLSRHASETWSRTSRFGRQ
jgi:hypothetical protein